MVLYIKKVSEENNNNQSHLPRYPPLDANPARTFLERTSDTKAPPHLPFCLSPPLPNHHNFNPPQTSPTQTHPSKCLVNVEEPLLAGPPRPPQSPQPPRPHHSAAQLPPLPTPSLALRHRSRRHRHRLPRPKDLVSSDRWHRLLRKSINPPSKALRHLHIHPSSTNTYTNPPRSGVAVGSSIGHAVGGWFGGGSSAPADAAAPQSTDFAQQHQDTGAAQMQQSQSGVCANDVNTFRKCMDENQGSLTVCGWYLDQLKACQQAAGQY
jgi:hypothetical protein